MPAGPDGSASAPRSPPRPPRRSARPLRHGVAPAVWALDAQRGVDLRQPVGEDRVDDDAADLDHLADVLALAVFLVRHWSPGEGCGTRRRDGRTGLRAALGV